MTIDVAFNMYDDANGGDPDKTSQTLRQYHKLLWSKLLPNGHIFQLSDNHTGAYLYYKTDRNEYFLGSDAITHSYRNHKGKHQVISQIPDDVNELFVAGSTIGAYILFPNNRIDGKQTINQARGVHALINDRFDLTLECIQRFYLLLPNPMNDTLLRYKDFFNLFVNYEGYTHFFLLDDFIDKNLNIKFFLPFDDLKTRPQFTDKYSYLHYKNQAIAFIHNRNSRIEVYLNNLNDVK